jgi:hypothetical protein
MKRVEQVRFTRVGASRLAGSQAMAASPGVCADDVRELAAWEPSRDSMRDTVPEAESLNFHPLPSGAYCISRTRLADGAHAGQRMDGHCLIVSPEVLGHFGNHPFTLDHAASQQGLWRHDGDPGPTLPSLTLSGGAAAVDETLLAELAADESGPGRMATLVQAARDSVCLAVVCGPSPDRWIAGLLNCLPPALRLDFSFATGLKFSPRRAFRIVALSDDPAERLWLSNYPNVTVVDLFSDVLEHPIAIDGWSRLVERALALGRIEFLASQMSKRRFELTQDDLPALGLQLLEYLDVGEWSNEPLATEAEPAVARIAPGRAHAAHHQFGKSAAMPANPAQATWANSDPNCPEILDKLEHLDDLVYEAISGQATSIEQLRSAWPRLLEELGEAHLAESREQYLRYALSIWEGCVESNGVRDATRAVQALDVLCLLFGDAT